MSFNPKWNSSSVIEPHLSNDGGECRTQSGAMRWNDFLDYGSIEGEKRMAQLQVGQGTV